MQVLETHHHNARIESTLLGVEILHRSQITKQFPPIDQLQNQVQILGILSKPFKPHNKRMANLCMNEILVVHMIDLLGFYYLGFF